MKGFGVRNLLILDRENGFDCFAVARKNGNHTIYKDYLNRYFLKQKNHSNESMLYVGAYLLFPRGSTIGDGRLNCRVRNENGCTPSAEAPTYNIHLLFEWFFIIFDLNTVK